MCIRSVRIVFYSLGWKELSQISNTDGDIIEWSFVWVEGWDPAGDVTVTLMEGVHCFFKAYMRLCPGHMAW